MRFDKISLKVNLLPALALVLVMALIPIHGKAHPNASPPNKTHLKKGEHLKITPQSPLTAKIVPTVSSHDPRTFPKNLGPTEFALTNIKGRLVLRFITKDPKLQLNTNGSIIVQFLPDVMYTILPSILTNAQWPKNSTQVALGIEGPMLKNGVLIRGKASYSYCSTGGKNCKRALSHITYFYHP